MSTGMYVFTCLSITTVYVHVTELAGPKYYMYVFTQTMCMSTIVMDSNNCR